MSEARYRISRTLEDGTYEQRDYVSHASAVEQIKLWTIKCKYTGEKLTFTFEGIQ